MAPPSRSIALSAAARIHDAWQASLSTPPDLAQLLAPDLPESALAEALVADAEERRRRSIPAALEHYQTSLPDAASRPRVRRALLMFEAADRLARAESPDALRADLLSRFPAFAVDVRAVMGMAVIMHSATVAAPADPLVPGQSIGKYSLIDPLGAGTFGEVWRAWDRELERYVALKVLHPLPENAESAESELDCFLAEARAAASLEHTGIVAVHHAGRFDELDRAYIDSQLAGDPDPTHDDPKSVRVARPLDRVVAERGPLAPCEAARITRDIALAVAAAHSRAILHRDIKPANILLTASGRTLVADFGLSASALPIAVPASRADPHTLTANILTPSGGRVVGTPAFMAPEQARGGGGESPTDRLTPLTDIFAIGLTLRFLLTGLLPYQPTGRFNPDPRTDVLHQAREAELVPLRTLAPRVPVTLAAIADRAAAPRPEDRYISAQQLAADLDAFLSHRPTIAAPPRKATAVALWFRRHTFPAAFGSLAAAILIGSTSFYLVHLADQRDRAQAAETAARTAEAATRAALADAVNSREAVDAANSFIASTLNAAHPARLGRNATILAALDEASKNVSSLKDRPLVEAAVRHTVGSTFLAIARPETGEEHLARALILRREHLGPEHPDTLDTWRMHASAIFNLGKSDEGAAELAAAAEACSRVLGLDHRTTLAALNTLGTIRLLRGELDEAERLQRAVLDARARTLGEDHTDTLGAKRSLAQILAKTKRFQEAIPLQREAYDAISARYGRDSFVALVTLQDLAASLRDSGQSDLAEPALRESAEGLIKAVGPEHHNTLTAQHNLALFLLRQRKQPEEALAILRPAAETAIRVHSGRNTTALLLRATLGLALLDAGHPDDAERTLLEALADATTQTGGGGAGGDSGPDAQRLIAYLVHLYEERGDSVAAARYRDRLAKSSPAPPP